MPNDNADFFLLQDFLTLFQSGSHSNQFTQIALSQDHQKSPHCQMQFQWQEHEAHSFFPYALSHSSLLVFLLPHWLFMLLQTSQCWDSLKLSPGVAYLGSLCHLQNDLTCFHTINTMFMMMTFKLLYPSKISSI